MRTKNPTALRKQDYLAKQLASFYLDGARNATEKFKTTGVGPETTPEALEEIARSFANATRRILARLEGMLDP